MVCCGDGCRPLWVGSCVFFVFFTPLFLLTSTITIAQTEQGSRGEGLRANIVGTIRNTEGRPLQGVEVVVQEEENATKVVRATTDERGQYLFECLDADRYNVAVHPGTANIKGQTTVVELRSDGLIVDWVASPLEPATAFVHLGSCCRTRTLMGIAERNRANIVGVVLDGVGRPVQGIELLVQDARDQVVARAITNESGEYLLECLTWGTYPLILEPHKTGMLGRTFMTTLGRGGVIVDWTVSPATQAVAYARRGTCCGAPPPFSGLGALGAAAIGIGGAVGAAEQTGVFDDDDENDEPRRPIVSPSQ